MAEAIKHQIEAFKTLPDRSLAYSNVLHLHRLSANDSSSMEALSLSSPPLIPILISDIQSQDEEMYAFDPTISQSLLLLSNLTLLLSLQCCSGSQMSRLHALSPISGADLFRFGLSNFRILLIVGCCKDLIFGAGLLVFEEEVGGLVLESLAKLIMGTRMKAICNLGVWCISIEQLGDEVVRPRVDVLLRAVVYGLDNPFGSLSTTFEAMQAVTKLATRFHEKMRINSEIWVRPICRRLISNDKKERDMAERCLLKSKLIICPPSLSLSKAVKLDLKKQLLPSMLAMLHNCQQKVQMIQAWGWYICLLSSGSLKSRHIINEMLKFPEHTFRDPDPQVQIATLVAWEQLVDALLPPQKIDLEMDCNDQVNGLLKRLKVLIKPLQGILSINSDISVRSSCLETWHYLLHKLDLSVNHPSVVRTTFWPIFESIFSKGIDSTLSVSLWISCFHLLDEYILSRVPFGETKASAEKSPCFILDHVILKSAKCSIKDYPIKWLPWKTRNLEFLLKMISHILSQLLVVKITPEHRILVFSYSLQIFKSALRKIVVELKMPSTCYEDIMFCINTILKFAKDVCDDEASLYCAKQCNEFICLAFRFVESIREEMDYSIFASPLYQVSLDLQYIQDMRLSESMENKWVVEPFGIKSLVYMDMVSPMVYTTILVLCTMAQSSLDVSILNTDFLCVVEHIKLLFFSANPLLNLHAAASFLYAHLGKPSSRRLQWLMWWRIIANGLLDMIDSLNGLSCSSTECSSANCTVFSQFLCYPFVMLLHPLKVSVSTSATYCSDSCLLSSQSNIELEAVIGKWNLLFDSLSSGTVNKLSSTNNFSECLAEMLIKTLDENTMMALQEDNESSIWNSQKISFFLVFGELVICIVEHAQVLDSETSGCNAINQEFSSQNERSPISSTLRLVIRFMEVSLNIVERNLQAVSVVVCRFFAAMTCLVGRIFLKKDILLLMELISTPLVRWLDFCASIPDKLEQSSIVNELQCLWKQILGCLLRSQPPIIFDSSCIGVQASLLRISLDHPHLPISDAAIAFWKATYNQYADLVYPQCLAIAFWKATYNQYADLVYPQCLLPVLDKLSGSGRISLHPERSVTFANKGSLVKEVTGLSRRRILGENAVDRPHLDSGCLNMVASSFRKKRFKIV